MNHINKHWTDEMDSNNKKLSFISSFNDICEMEIVAVLTSWMTNFHYDENYFIEKFVNEKMQPTPFKFILDYDQMKFQDNNKCFFYTLTNHNLNELLQRIQIEILAHGSLKTAYIKNGLTTRKFKHKYAHETLASMFGGDTGFQTRLAHCAFYRYNLLFYWLTRKLKIWNDVDTSNALIPCNDFVFRSALKHGIIKKPMKSTLSNAIELTQIAKDIYGNDNHYELYEKLISYD